MSITVRQTLSRHSFKALILGAILIGVAAGVFQLDKYVTIAIVGALAAICALLEWNGGGDVGAWQRQIDREYTLEIAGSEVTVFRFGKKLTEFEFIDPIEIRYLSRKGEFPPLFWKIITKDGEFMLPDGGRYANEFEKKFIYALPGYHDQQVVKISPPPDGFSDATSMWRKDDSFPKRERLDEEFDW